ncbi:exodeoxyribonuclease VII small subunit [Rummeliibacillus stabekisii]|uniref:Exodeoxyribonuclease 7 small subunit n=1 Tax=Rummeliibacillus stabekisii TaxID=241244 RepID=A0A143HBQ9_9BACL|nr:MULTISPECIES: exodeoxyribonuclease VII small subunit [Rummeliibacillus]AMW98849.1 exodeoxyribonuclease VII small subunit [Rummeliibacillus stabekisii]MCM3316256.1 exodeoxyribonuclease VII small subunit [Rummeliibacillus stabekisii]
MANEKQTFQTSINELEEIVQVLETGEVPLEDAIEMYKKGMKLSKFCHDQLTKAEEQLVSIMDDSGKEKPFEPTGEEGNKQ